MRKAQTSLEYLIILAIVVIIALAAVSALGGVPSLGGETSEGVSEAYWGRAQIAIPSHIISSDGSASFVLTNNKKFKIRINNMSVDGNDISGAQLQVFKSGQTKTVTAGSGTFSCSAEEPYGYEIVINYTDREYNLGPYSFTGSEKLRGECQAA